MQTGKFLFSQCTIFLIHYHWTRGNSTMMHTWAKFIQYTYFLYKVYHNLLVLMDNRYHFGAFLGGHFKQYNHQQKSQKLTQMALNSLKKHNSLEYESWNNKAERMFLCSTSVLHMLTNEGKNTSHFKYWFKIYRFMCQLFKRSLRAASKLYWTL